MMTTILTIHVPSTPGRAWNMLVALQAGNIVARYAKLHLYDAFAIQESRRVDAGNEIAPLLEVEGMKVGLMTCYDLRFPELALAQALQGAEILVLPAAWVRGPLKEHHWSTLLAARALDTTCYMVAAGECGNKNIGQSRIIDPFGVTIAAASEMPALIMAEVTPETCASGARATARLKQPSLCAAAIIMMFFYSALDSPCYRLLLCARVE